MLTEDLSPLIAWLAAQDMNERYPVALPGEEEETAGHLLCVYLRAQGAPAAALGPLGQWYGIGDDSGPYRTPPRIWWVLVLWLENSWKRLSDGIDEISIQRAWQIAQRVEKRRGGKGSQGPAEGTEHQAGGGAG